ncbi:MAG: translocation/assembly module TamB domain-containing protein [Polyangiaceae bacterium]
MNERPSMLPERLSALFTAPRRFRRAVGRIAAALGLAVVFTAALAVSAIVHLRSRVGLRAARALVNDLLADSFRGRLELGEITDVSLGGIALARAQVFDVDGRVVVDAEGLTARFSTVHLLRSLLLENGPNDPIWIAAPYIRIERGLVRLLPDASGSPSISAAFSPRTVQAPKPDARPVVVALPRIELGEVAVEGDVGRPIHGRVTGLVGSVGVSSTEVIVDVDEARLEDDALLLTRWEGAANYHLRVDLPGRRAGGGAPPRRPSRSSMWMGFHGSVGPARLDVDAELAGEHVVAKVELPSITPAALRAFLPAAPLESSGRATIEVEGTLPELTANARVELDPSGDLPASSIELEALVDASARPRVEASFLAERVDPRAFVPSLPDVSVRAVGRARFALEPDALIASVEFVSHAAVLRPTQGAEPVVIPAIDAVADLVDDAWVGSATLHEAGAPLDARFTVRPDGGLAFSARGDRVDLASAPRLAALVGPGVLRGFATLDVKGAFSRGELAADARASVWALGVESPAGPVRAESVGVIAKVEGPLTGLRVDVAAQALNLGLADQSFDRVELSAKGPLLRPDVALVLDDEELGHASARASVDVEHRSATAIAVNVERGGEKAEATVKSVAAAPGGVAIEGVAISGELGSAEASLRIEDGELVGTFKGEGLDLDRLRKLAGLREPIGGIANVDVALERGPRGRRGHIEIEVQRGQYLVEGIAARLSARFDGDDVESTGYARVVVHATDEERDEAREGGLLAENALCDGPIAEVRLSSLKGKLRGPILSPSTWLGATGDAKLSVENVNLKCISEYPLVSLFLPVSKVAGLVSVRAHVAREEGDPLPSIRDLAVRTLGLEIVGPRALFGDAEPWEIRAIDLAARGEFDGRTGHATAKASFFDGTLLADVTGEVTVDPVILGRAMIQHGSSAAHPGVVRLFEEAPMAATIDFPRRSFADMRSFPSFVRDALPPLRGDLRFDASASGTLAHPVIELHANAFGVGPSTEPGPNKEGTTNSPTAVGWAPDLDVDLHAAYDDRTSMTTFDALVNHREATVARVDGGLRMSFADILHPKTDQPLGWSAGAVVTLNGMPLQSFPNLSRYDVAGRVDGSIVVSGLNEDPSLDAKLTVPDLTIGDVSYSTRVDVHIGANADEEKGSTDGRGSATALVELTGKDGNGLVAFGIGASDWKDKLQPDIDRRGPAFLCVVPRRFELATLTPLVVPTLSHVEGHLTGAIGLGLPRAEDLQTGTMGGALRIEDGSVLIPQLGQELSGVHGEIVVDPSGEVHVDDLVAQGIAGELDASLRAKFSGLDFKSAKGKLKIAEGKEIPFTLEGVPVGFASTELDYEATYTPANPAADQPPKVTITTNVPIVRLQLPESSSRDVQDLDEDPTITRSESLAPPEAPRAANAMIYEVSVKLDKAVVSGSDLGVTIAGSEAPIVLELSDQLHVRGEVTLASGFVRVRGKQFVIDHGLVRLRPEEAGNPYVNLTAHWEGTDGQRVYIDYVGVLYPITDEKIRFRSDPPRSKEDIIATLLFGSSLSSTPAGQAPTEATTQGVSTLAADLTSTLASSALNSIFKAKNLSLTVDTTSGAFRGSVEWRASEGLTLGVSGEQVQSTTASGATQQAGAQFGGTIEWRLNDNWFIRSTFGAGVREPSTGVDIFWTAGY